jgi:hypothetical protein
MEAQTKVRHMLLSGIAPMDWKKDFAVLEDACGHELAVWHHGAANA